MQWVSSLLNACARTHRLPILWRQARVVVLLKPGKDPSSPKSFRPISLLCHLYKLHERLILNRLSPMIYNMTRGYCMMCMIRTLLENRRFFVEVGGKRSRCRSQRNGLPPGVVLAPHLINVYTNDQPIHPGTRSFVYAYDLEYTTEYLEYTTQSTDFAPIEETLTSALLGLSE